MYRLLIRCIKISNLDIQTNSLPRNISFSTCCIKQSHKPSIDELRDIPHFVETRYDKLTKNRFTDFLTTKLSCPTLRASEICKEFPKFSQRTLQDVSRNLSLLMSKGVTQTIILDNTWMLTLSDAHLNSNSRILKNMQPKDINDFARLAIIPLEKLKRIQEIAENEANIIPQKHRIYYFSELLQVSPYTVSQHASKHLFVLTLPFDKLESRMKVLLKFIAPENIVKNFGKLRSIESKIEFILTRALTKSKESKLSKKMKKSLLEKEILGERSLEQFYADRLKVDIEIIQSMLQRHPALQTFTVILAAKKLDYLMNEVGITTSKILQSPYILTNSSVERTRKRIHELESLGCARKDMLCIVFQNSQRYEKFLANLNKTNGMTGDK